MARGSSSRRHKQTVVAPAPAAIAAPSHAAIVTAVINVSVAETSSDTGARSRMGVCTALCVECKGVVGVAVIVVPIVSAGVSSVSALDLTLLSICAGMFESCVCAGRMAVLPFAKEQNVLNYVAEFVTAVTDSGAALVEFAAPVMDL